MISREEVGLIVAGVAITSGIISQSIYAAIIGMVMVTTVLPPILLKKSYDNVPPEEPEKREPPDLVPTYPL
jgi:Kef-type K+ transport system membrane component KefB